MSKSKVLTLDDLLDTVGDLQHEGKSIVTTNGCFDLLHVGHLRYLQAAKSLGDVLIVLINSDESVKKLKGPSRPLVVEDERAEMLAGLSCIDYVTVFKHETPVMELERIRPNIHVKGGDYDVKSLPEAPVLEGMGSELVFIPLIPGRSTSNLIAKMGSG